MEMAVGEWPANLRSRATFCSGRCRAAWGSVTVGGNTDHAGCRNAAVAHGGAAEVGGVAL